MYSEKHVILRSLPAYTVNVISDKTVKIRKYVSNHKEGIATAAILGTAAVLSAISMKSLSDKVNA